MCPRSNDSGGDALEGSRLSRGTGVVEGWVLDRVSSVRTGEPGKRERNGWRLTENTTGKRRKYYRPLVHKVLTRL